MLKTFKKELPKQKKILTSFLKKFDKKYVRTINKLVSEASDETWEKTDCLTCGNCCKVMTPTFTKTDIKRISAHFDMTEKAFFDKWLMKDADNGDNVNKVQPCQFLNLKDNKCSIYEIRPFDCSEFPHFKRKPFGDFNHIHTQNIDYCPATFDFVNRLKEKIEKEYTW
jgi:Fe-S-cluster containining protein